MRALDNPWVNRAGNLAFLVGAFQTMARLLMGFSVNAIGIVLLGLGFALMLLPKLRLGGRETQGGVGPLDGRYAAVSDLLAGSVSVGLRLSEDGDWPLRDAWEVHTRSLVSAAYGNGEATHIFTPNLSAQRSFTGLDIINAPRPLATPIERIRELLGRMPSLAIQLAFKPDGWNIFDPDAYRSEHALEIRELDGGEFRCPWCGAGIGEHSSDCDVCGAERGGDFLYKKSTEGPPAYAQLLRMAPVDDGAELADLFKEGEDLRSACTKAPDGNLAQKAHWHVLGGTPQQQCAREDQAREWDQRVSDLLWAKTNLKRFGPGWKPAGAPIRKAAGHPDQSMMNPSRLADWYLGKLDYLRSVIEKVGQVDAAPA